ncbi:neurexin-1-like isoform X2 [Watersipora subatra]|uniref:neurexin-1-like isoform X2 n=1 Tax=Watersipora subatra TaxID=2589382 RepID=UPI00355BF729
MPVSISLGERRSPKLELTSQVSLAGLALTDSGMKLHPAVYTSGLRRGFVGCLRDVKIDGMYQDLRRLAQAQGVRVSASCNQSALSCSRNRCRNGGMCEQTTRCNCYETAYIGRLCSDESPVIRFNGQQQVKVKPQVKWVTLAEDILLQFRTGHAHGALLNSRNVNRRSGLDMFLHLGRLYIRIALAGIEHVLVIGENLNDNRWHSLIFKRRVKQVKVTFDNIVVKDEELPFTRQQSLLEQAITIDEIKLGQPIDGDVPNSAGSDWLEPTSRTSFVGHMRQLLINNIAYFELASQGGNKDVTFTAEVSSSPTAPIHPVTFGSADTFVVKNLAAGVGHITFSLKLKTQETDGLIIFRNGKRRDFIALEMLQGLLYYRYNVRGELGRIQASRNSRVNDGQWHEVIVMKLANGSQSMIIDGTNYISQGNVKEEFRFREEIYIAGVPSDMYYQLPSSLQADKGYKGCLASLDVNGLRLDLTPYIDNNIRLGTGCFDPSACAPDSCQNSGVCTQSWPQVNCSCEMTTFSGPTCADDATTYDFGRTTGGLIEYRFPAPQPDTMSDNLAIGFITSLKTRATILKVISSNSNDFLEIYILDGEIRARYNVGTETRTLTYPSFVNDRVYHVLTFTRKGYNSTLQIDDGLKITDIPQDAHLKVFNSQSRILVGGYISTTGTIASPFVGQLTGVNLNGLAVLDKAKENHQHITIQGDAQMIESGSRRDDVMIHDMVSMDAGKGENSGEILVLATDKPTCVPGLDADYCNKVAGSEEIVDRKIAVSSIVPVTVTKPPVIEWPGGDIYEPTTVRQRYTIRTERVTDPREDTSYQRIREFYPSSTHGPFDLKRNLPLIAGICGAALITVILIAVIIYRLTRKDSRNYASTPRHHPSSSIDDDLKNSINGQRTDASTPHTPLPLNGSSQRSGSKEWYV